jgi:xanthine dehydrogenase small subunit
MTVLDFVRYHQHLKGTKIGCREGDCGACTLLIGHLHGGAVKYQSMTSCLMPLANAHGKHIVTVEGINPEKDKLTPVQQAIANHNGTQCGFCTVGFVMTLTGYCLEDHPPSMHRAISAMDGNICRCTGYKSLERAAESITEMLQAQNGISPISSAIDIGIIPAWFSSIKKRLAALPPAIPSSRIPANVSHASLPVGGGTDLYVQRGEEMSHNQTAYSVFDTESLKGINESNGFVEIGGSATVTDMLESPVMNRIFPRLEPQLKLISSTPIRNMATVAGNLVNASPIGDLTIWFLALNASVVLRHKETREIPLRDFYLEYKKLNKQLEDIVEKIRFPIPTPNHHFNFEKVSKRTYLDIATVNTAIQFHLENDMIKEAHLSAGGVAPIPLYLNVTSAFLRGKKIPFDEKDFADIFHVMQSDIRPISDVRGSATYKRLLLQQLFRAHCITLFPAE